MKRAATVCVKAELQDLNIKVEKFQSHDEAKMGKHHKKWNWTFNIAGSKQEWEIKVDEQVAGKSLHFMVDGVDIFKKKLDVDFEHKVPVRGLLQMNREYECSDQAGRWYLGTLTEVKEHGRYAAEVLMPPDEDGNEKKVYWPILEVHRIRDPFTKELVEVPSSTIHLIVKRDSALMPVVTIDNKPFTDCLCVPTPAATTAHEITGSIQMTRQDLRQGSQAAVVNFTVSKDRKDVTADIGHQKLQEAVDATRPEYKIYSKGMPKTSKLKCEWGIRIGAFGEHHIVAETKSKSKEVNVSIDGILVAGGTAADLGCRGNEWYAEIAMQGTLTLNFQIHKTNIIGMATDETAIVTKTMPHSHTLKITCPDLNNLETATLECDGVDWRRLQQDKGLPKEPMIHTDIEGLESAHGISVPYAMNTSKDFAGEFAETVPGGKFLLSLFGGCICKAQAIDEDYQVIDHKAERISDRQSTY